MSENTSCCGHDDHNHSHGDFNLKNELSLLGLILVFYLPAVIFEEQLHGQFFGIGEYILFIAAYLLSGWTVLKTAGRNLLKGKFFDENFLMTISTLGAFAIHKLPEAVGVMLFYKIGELFQDLATSKSRKSIKALLEIRPDFANLKTEEGIKIVKPETIKIDEIIIIKPGEKIPLDGLVIEGKSMVDTAALTGESVPCNMGIGETVLAGSINQNGVLTVQVTKLFNQSSIAKILKLVQNAGSKKAKSEKFITQFAKIYTPIVVIISLLIALIPPLVIPGSSHAEWVYRALVILVISCPCGLVISIPLGYFGGVGGAAKKGILVKGATFLDAIAVVKAVVFDKTGTLTKGVFKVTEIVVTNGMKPEELLKIAATTELYSNHPIAQSIRLAYNRPIEEERVTNYQEIAGYGITALLDKQTVLAGNERLMQREKIAYSQTEAIGTVIHLAIDKSYAGYLVISDELKEDAAVAIPSLKKLGVEKTIMLTGDTHQVAQVIAERLQLDSYQAELLPEDKVMYFEKVLHEFRGKGTVAYVGDGINDAPVLARADIGIAMGGLGSDAAIETADIVIMTDSPLKVAEAVEIGRKTKEIVWQNIIFALSIKVLFIILGIFGVATMWEAIFADVGVALLAILNATRTLR